jgi:hypothetical protein
MVGIDLMYLHRLECWWGDDVAGVVGERRLRGRVVVVVAVWMEIMVGWDRLWLQVP